MKYKSSPPKKMKKKKRKMKKKGKTKPIFNRVGSKFKPYKLKNETSINIKNHVTNCDQNDIGRKKNNRVSEK